MQEWFALSTLAPAVTNEGFSLPHGLQMEIQCFLNCQLTGLPCVFFQSRKSNGVDKEHW